MPGLIVRMEAGDGPDSIVEIGPSIKVRIVDVRGEQVTLCVEAPPALRVQKLADKIRALRERD